MDHIILNPNNDKALIADTALKALRTANASQTHNSGSMFVADGKTDENGIPMGTGTIINGNSNGGIQEWVNDKTPPGTPTGISADSATGMIFVLWDGTLDGGVPDDFHHVAVLVDGKEVAELPGKGSYACGPYDIGSKHTITAIAYDDAHDSSGKSTPNASKASAGISVTVSGADIDPNEVGINVTKTTKAPGASDKGKNKGDLWLQYDKDPTAEGATLIGEWWWDGSKWDSIPVVVYLDQLAARGITADSAVIGLLSAGIIQSGTFRTSDTGARVEMNAAGINAYDANGDMTVQIDAVTGDVTIYGTFSTGQTGDRVGISPKFTQTSITKGGKVTGSGIEFPLANKYQQAPYIATESHDDTEGDISTIVFNGGQRTAGADGAQYGYGAFGRIGMRKDGANGNEASHVYFSASADYNSSNDKTPTSREWVSALDMCVPYGKDSYAHIASWGAGGIGAGFYASASSQQATMQSSDNNGSVGVEASIKDGYLYLGGYLGGWTGNRGTILTGHWKAWSGGSGNGRYANVTFTFSAPKYGGYTWLACADTTTDQSYIHTGFQSASSVQVMGWGNYGTDIYATLIAWYHA